MKHNVVEPLLNLLRPIEGLQPDLENARQHDDASVAAMAKVLEDFGQDQPLVVQKKGMVVRKGNKRLRAMKLLGWTHVAALVLDDTRWVAAARAIADNRMGERSTWNYAALAVLARGLKDDGQDVHDLGWQPGELSFLLGNPSDEPAKPYKASKGPSRGLGITLTDEQRVTFEQAYQAITKQIGGDISEGRALELICVDFLAGVH